MNVFCENMLNLIDCDLPKMFAIQSSSCAPIVTAFEKGKDYIVKEDNLILKTTGSNSTIKLFIIQIIFYTFYYA